MSGSLRRGPAWFLVHDQDGSIAAIERQAYRIDIQIDGLQRMRHAEVKARLERLGFDTSNFREAPPMAAWEQRWSRHLRDDVEAIVAAAQETKLDRAYREFLAANPHFEPQLRVR